MSFEGFQEKVRGLVLKAKADVNDIFFDVDEEKGEYRANCPGDITIIGYPSRLKMTVKWGSDHVAMTAI